MDALDSVLKIEERLVAKATLANIPIGGTFELLPLCNMNCEMCFIRLDKKEMESISPLKSANQWLELAKEMKRAGTLFVLLTGGEPFLYPEFKKVYKGLRNLGMIITINSNGTLINEEIAEFLEKDKPRRVNITLYGASNETYNKLCHNPYGFDQTMRGIELLKKHHIDIKLNGTLVPENEHEASKLIEIANKLELPIKIDTYIYPSNRKKIHTFNPSTRLSAVDAAKKSLEIKLKQNGEEEFNHYKHFMLTNCNKEITSSNDALNCRAGKSSFWITWDGYMTPCVFMDQPSINVFNTGFDASWKQLVEMTQQLHLPKSCMSCQNKDVCQICGACAYCENGNLDDKPEYMCAYTQEILKELMGEISNEKN